MCTDDGNPSALAISVQDGTASIEVAATIGCTGWISTTSTNPLVVDNVSPALQVASWGFAGDDGVVVQRSDDGTFDPQLVEEAIGFGNSLVMNQTIPDYTADDAVTAQPTNPPSADSSSAGVNAFLYSAMVASAMPVLAAWLLP